MYVLLLLVLVLVALSPPTHPATRGPLSPGPFVRLGPLRPSPCGSRRSCRSSWSSLFIFLKSPASQILIVYSIRSVGEWFLFDPCFVFFWILKVFFCWFCSHGAVSVCAISTLPVTKVLILTFCGEYEGIPEFNEDILRCILSFLTVRVASRLQRQKFAVVLEHGTWTNTIHNRSLLSCQHCRCFFWVKQFTHYLFSST